MNPRACTARVSGAMIPCAKIAGPFQKNIICCGPGCTSGRAVSSERGPTAALIVREADAASGRGMRSTRIELAVDRIRRPRPSVIGPEGCLVCWCCRAVRQARTNWSTDELAAIVTRDSMVGVTVPKVVA